MWDKKEEEIWRPPRRTEGSFTRTDPTCQASQEDRGVIYWGRSREGVGSELGVGHTGLESPVKQPRGEVKKADWQLQGF